MKLLKLITFNKISTYMTSIKKCFGAGIFNLLSFAKMIKKKQKEKKDIEEPTSLEEEHRICDWIAFKLGGEALTISTEGRIEVIHRNGIEIERYPIVMTDPSSYYYWISTISLPAVFSADVITKSHRHWSKSQAKIVLALLFPDIYTDAKIDNYKCGAGEFSSSTSYLAGSIRVSSRLVMKTELPKPKTIEELYLMMDLDIGGEKCDDGR